MEEWNDFHMLIPVQLDPWLLVDHLTKNATYDQIMEFIVAMDEAAADWEFTKMLIGYAKEQEEIYIAEGDL